MTIDYTQLAGIVYQACTTYDQYLPPLPPPLARSWAKVFEHYRLSPEDLLAGVDKVYLERGTGYRPLPADIADAARAIRQDRRMREPLPQIEHHTDERLAGMVTELAEAKTIPDDQPPRFQRRGIAGPRSIPCRHCHASPGQPCYNSATKRPLRVGHHPTRIDDASSAPQRPRAAASVAVADRTCTCGRDILNDHDTACDRCQPVINGPEKTSNGNGKSA